MKLIEKFKKKNTNKKTIPTNIDYEFTAELENHPIGNQNIYKLYYLFI